MMTRIVGVLVLSAALTGCVTTPPNTMQVRTHYERPKHISPAEHSILVKTCQLEGDKAALRYRKKYPPPYKEKFENSPLFKVRMKAIDRCVKAKGLKMKRKIIR